MCLHHLEIMTPHIQRHIYIQLCIDILRVLQFTFYMKEQKILILNRFPSEMDKNRLNDIVIIITQVLICECTGAVFNLLMDDRDHMLMEKIERHFGAHIFEVISWLFLLVEEFHDLRIITLYIHVNTVGIPQEDLKFSC